MISTEKVRVICSFELSETAFNTLELEMFLEQQISILELILKDHATL